jgi:hypothetical protein
LYNSAQKRFPQRLHTDLKNHIFICCPTLTNDNHSKDGPTKEQYSKHQLSRDLYLWAIFMDMPEMAEVFLLHLPCRVGAALIGSAIFKKYAALSQAADLKEHFKTRSLKFETYASNFLQKCYEYNELRACELLYRKMPLFGDITCMQVKS